MPCLLPSMSMSEKSVCGLNETKLNGTRRRRAGAGGQPRTVSPRTGGAEGGQLGERLGAEAGADIYSH